MKKRNIPIAQTMETVIWAQVESEMGPVGIRVVTAHRCGRGVVASWWFLSGQGGGLQFRGWVWIIPRHYQSFKFEK